MNSTQFEKHLTHIEMNLTQFEKSLTEFEIYPTYFETNLTELEMNLTHIEMNPTQFEGHPTQIDESVNNFVEIKTKLANSFASTFAIFHVPADSPIAKELTKPPLFCLSGNLVILPKKTKTILYFL